MIGNKFSTAFAFVCSCLLFSTAIAAVNFYSSYRDRDDKQLSPEEQSNPSENKDTKSKPVTPPDHKEAKTWRDRIDLILSSKSRQWKRAQLQQIAAELSRRRFSSDNENDLVILRVQELVHWSLNDVAAAKQTMERRYKLLASTHEPDALAEMAYDEGVRYSKRGLEKAARELYGQVWKLSPSSPKASLADKNIGVILRRMRNFKQAERQFLHLADKYKTTHPDLARQCHYLAGDSAWRAHDMTRADMIFNEIIRKYPGTPEAEDAVHMRKDIQKGERPEDFRPGYTRPEAVDTKERTTPGTPLDRKGNN